MKQKRIATALLISCLSASLLTGCQFNTETAETETTIQTESTQVLGIGEPATMDEYEFGVTDLKSFTIEEPSGEIRKYIIVGVTYTNLTDETVQITESDFDLFLNNEEKFSVDYDEEDYGGFVAAGLMFGKAEVKAGRTKTGYIIYRYYRDYNDIEICFDTITVVATKSDVSEIYEVLPTDPAETLTEPSDSSETETETTPVETTAPEPEPTEPEAPVEEIVPEAGSIVFDEPPAEG